MAEASGTVLLSEASKKSLLARLVIPLTLLLAGVAVGAAGAMLLPPVFPDLAAEKPAQPRVAPLQYVEIDNSFTVNLQDTGRFVQVRIAISTQGGQPVVDAMERHRVAILAAVLDVLADSSEQALAQSGGREALRRRMRTAINDVLRRKAGMAGVDDVFLTSFVMQ
jgi:flagellar FliL protein